MDQRHKTNAIYWPAKYTGIKEFSRSYWPYTIRNLRTIFLNTTKLPKWLNLSCYSDTISVRGLVEAQKKTASTYLYLYAMLVIANANNQNAINNSHQSTCKVHAYTHSISIILLLFLTHIYKYTLELYQYLSTSRSIFFLIIFSSFKII